MPPRKAAQAAAQAIAAPTRPPPTAPAPKKPPKKKAPLVPGRKPTLIVDNGAGSIKVTWVDRPGSGGAEDEEGEVRTVLNAITRAGPRSNRKTFVADELERECRDYDKLQYNLPMEKGILTDWNIQKTIWDRLFGEDGLNIDFDNTRLLVTEAPFSLPNVQDSFDQMVCEEYEFAEYLRVPAALLSAFGPPPPIVGVPNKLQPKRPDLSECAIVIDSGYSFTHVVPVIDGAVVWSSVRRLDIGGKLLTNYLKELLSYRHLYMMDQTHVVNRIKESVSYVAQDFSAEIRRFEKEGDRMTIDYALPDFTDLSSDATYKLGYVKDGTIPPPPPRRLPDAPADSEAVEVEEQILTLGRERFEVMEVLFRPSLIGLKQAGIAEVILQSIESLPTEVQGICWANLIATGGNFRCPGMDERLLKELRAWAPDQYEVQLRKPANPVTYAAEAAAFALSSPILHGLLDERFLSKQEYLEAGGSDVCRSLFGGAYADIDLLFDSAGGEGNALSKKGKKRGRRTSSGEESELDDIIADEKPEYIVRSTASRKRAAQ